ncbi:DUF1707 domain-containing protein [Micromonospora sp. WMMD998]|uniref:DUF1707 SHOCT-like domain-containing protein n=1 Tax=Micromonospora sp. WMMD998 TaxID=3016092 RepID=UPI002499B815|nr:DUF1707 domain-containing protein [Micromonospora sp. WMMD998]WFE42410.1 DUF1707 domain-containing protein [Micromonospora sp. WMMD998]
MDGRREMRAADRDREAVAERLRVALEEGRLGLHEYDERLARAYGARTYGELDELVADLPGVASAERSALAPTAPTPPPAAPAGSEPATSTGPGPSGAPAASGGSGSPETRSRLLWLWMPWLRVAAILLPIWLISVVASGHVAGVWPLWVLGPWGGLVLMQSVGLIGADHGRKRHDRRG